MLETSIFSVSHVFYRFSQGKKKTHTHTHSSYNEIFICKCFQFEKGSKFIIKILQSLDCVVKTSMQGEGGGGRKCWSSAFSFFVIKCSKACYLRVPKSQCDEFCSFIKHFLKRLPWEEKIVLDRFSKDIWMDGKDLNN